MTLCDYRTANICSVLASKTAKVHILPHQRNYRGRRLEMRDFYRRTEDDLLRFCLAIIWKRPQFIMWMHMCGSSVTMKHIFARSQYVFGYFLFVWVITHSLETMVQRCEIDRDRHISIMMHKDAFAVLQNCKIRHWHID